MIAEKILIPLLKALITGVLVALFTAAWFIPAVPWKLFAATLSGVCLVSWLMVIRISDQGNGAVTLKPSKVYPVETTRIEITAADPSGAFSAGRWAELPISRESIDSVARRIAAGASFSHAGLAGPGRPLSRSEYEVLRDEFIARGLAYWINPDSHSQGVELSRAGVAVMEHFAGGDGTVTPLPQLPEKVRRSNLLPSAAHAHRNTREEGLLGD